MIGSGSLLWIVAIGAVIYFMMKKGGGCCGGGHDKEHKSHTNESGDDKNQPRGGCCG